MAVYVRHHIKLEGKLAARVKHVAALAVSVGDKVMVLNLSSDASVIAQSPSVPV